MISKIDLRKELVNKRKTLKTNILSAKICEKIKNQKEYICAKSIFAYYPKKYEVNILPLFKDINKNWFLPKTNNDELVFYKYNDNDDLIKSEFGVYVPKSNIEADIVPDLIIVPALSVDKNNYRLGYGKGYYDRFLPKLTGTYIICVCFPFQMFEEIPSEEFDIKMDRIFC